MPFVDCERFERVSDYNRRMFAYAFRVEDQDCEDIQMEKRLANFIFRVQNLWYSAPLGTVMHFVRMDNSEFDDDLGFKRDVPVDWSEWNPSHLALTFH